MRKISKYRLTSAIIAVAVCLCGCSFANNTDEKKAETDPTIVFTFGEDKVTKGETYIYVKTLKEHNEVLQTGEAISQEDVINEIIRVKTLASKENQFGIVLSQEKVDELRTKAEEFCDGLNENDVQTMEITSDMAYNVLYENEIADLVMEKLLADEALEVSDEEARLTTFYDMYFECYSLDSAGNVVPYSDEEKKKQYENAIQACSTLATADIDDNKEAKSIDKLAAYYNLSEAKEYTLTPAEIKNTYGDVIYDYLYSMNNGDYSTVIESEYGYHVFQMIALTDQKATALNKEKIEESRVDNMLSSTIDNWEKSIDSDFSYPDSVNMNVYNTIEF